MDINGLGIGGLIGAVLTVIVNLYLQYINVKSDRSKEQFKNLYNPLNSVIIKNKKYLDFMKLREELFEKYTEEYYSFFLELRDIYINNEVYASIELRNIFHSLLHNHEIEFYNYSKIENDVLLSKEEINKRVAFFLLNHKKNENGNSEFEENLESVIKIVGEDILKIYDKKIRRVN